MAQQTIINNSVNGGTSALGLLLVAFIVLKLTGYITWSWLWVLSPLWLPLGVFTIIALLILGVALLLKAGNW